jgi:chemotaxis signal transduction protein
MREVKAVEAVWRERAERLSERQVSAGPEQNAVPVLVLRIAEERYAIDLPDVAEVLPLTRPTPVPGTSAVLAGVINVHGEIRPVIDLKRFLGIEAAEDGPARVILLRKDGRELGLQIDTVEHIRWIGTEELGTGELGARECQGSGNRHAGSPRIRGSTKDLLMLLSTEALFAEMLTGVAN